MDTSMFCFQCEQTARGTGCTSSRGVCGKTAPVADLQDELTGALVDLARATGGTLATPEVNALMREALFACVTNVSFDGEHIASLTKSVREATRALACADVDPFDIKTLWNETEDIRSLKSIVLFGIRGMAAYAYHAAMLGRTDDSVDACFYESLVGIGASLSVDELIALGLKVGQANLACMALLDEANTATYGNPTPTEVPLCIEPGPFIIVSGHDLCDLEALLRQTDGTGVNVYTHGEMLPAHGYPQLKAHPQLKGNFGTAWFRQQKEFDGVPAPILFTTNCLMPPRSSYADRVYTTGPVAYPDLQHVPDSEGDKDFSALIEHAKQLGGYTEATQTYGANGGTSMTTGFGHAAVLGVADAVIDAVKQGVVKHFLLVGGCDGACADRSYYTEVAREAPEDTIILTLGCGKFRLNDLDLGTIGGLPRLLDIGQCNDAYGAIKIALALAEVFECGVNDLPLTLVLSWYEQKSVCILLTLLYLGIKGIYLGPTLPAFVSPGVLDVLVQNYDIHPTSTAQDDLATILGQEAA